MEAPVQDPQPSTLIPLLASSPAISPATASATTVTPTLRESDPATKPGASEEVASTTIPFSLPRSSTPILGVYNIPHVENNALDQLLPTLSPPGSPAAGEVMDDDDNDGLPSLNSNGNQAETRVSPIAFQWFRALKIECDPRPGAYPVRGVIGMTLPIFPLISASLPSALRISLLNIMDAVPNATITLGKTTWSSMPTTRASNGT
jgi:hypothetical protein